MPQSFKCCLPLVSPTQPFTMTNNVLTQRTESAYHLNTDASRTHAVGLHHVKLLVSSAADATSA